MDSNNSKVTVDPHFGHGLVANSDLGAGKLVIGISNPLVVIVEKAALDTVCSQCLAEHLELKRCSGCKVTRYCSTTCQAKSWKAGHKKECAVLKKLPDIPPTPVRALIQLLLGHKTGTQPDAQWAGLETHIMELKRSKRWDEIILQAKAGLEFSSRSADWMEVAIGILCRMTTNAFRVTLADNSPIGLCFEPTISLANHSCTPNAAIIFDGRQIMLRTLTPIKRDEQIFISYIDSTQDRASRQAELQDRYFFECKCKKCLNNDSPYSTYEKFRPDISSKFDLLIDPKSLDIFAAARAKSPVPESVHLAFPQVQTLILYSKRSSDSARRFKSLRQAMSLLSPLAKEKQYALSPYTMVLHELYLVHLDEESYAAALIILLFIHLNTDVYNYPQACHPIRVIRLFTIGKLLRHVASLPTSSLIQNMSPKTREVVENIDWISALQATLILVAKLSPMSHGAGSRFVLQVEEEIREVEEVQRMRGNVGVQMKRWGEVNDEVEEGREYARKVFDGLRTLGECFFDLIE